MDSTRKSRPQVVPTNHAKERWAERIGDDTDELIEWLAKKPIKEIPRWVKGGNNTRHKNHAAITGTVWIPETERKEHAVLVCITLLKDQKQNSFVATTVLTREQDRYRYRV